MSEVCDFLPEEKMRFKYALYLCMHLKCALAQEKYACQHVSLVPTHTFPSGSVSEAPASTCDFFSFFFSEGVVVLVLNCTLFLFFASENLGGKTH